MRKVLCSINCGESFRTGLNLARVIKISFRRPIKRVDIDLTIFNETEEAAAWRSATNNAV